MNLKSFESSMNDKFEAYQEIITLKVFYDVTQLVVVKLFGDDS